MSGWNSGLKILAKTGTQMYGFEKREPKKCYLRKITLTLMFFLATTFISPTNFPFKRRGEDQVIITKWDIGEVIVVMAVRFHPIACDED